MTLHVGAGTFKPIKSETIFEHEMHVEKFVVSRLLVQSALSGNQIIAVGTTSMRVLESLYWLGVKLIKGQPEPFLIDQWDGYSDSDGISTMASFKAILDYLDYHGISAIQGATKIFIVPGYVFRVCKGLITNFHQPGSTLILLVAAFIGKDWRRVYETALLNGYRFLSYGDSSFLLPK